MQAKILCTATRAKKVILCLLLGSMIAQLSAYIPFHLAGTLTVYRIQDIVFSVVLPLAVLVINVIVVREVRQASLNASANLGRQQHQQLASSSVPTVMLVTISLVYVLLTGVAYFLLALIRQRWIWWSAALFYCSEIPLILSFLVFAYNFYVYLITGQQFRSELHKLFCCCCCSACDEARVARHRQTNTTSNVCLDLLIS